MLQAEVVKNDKMVYPLGMTRLKGAAHVSVQARAKAVNLLLYPHGSDDKAEPEKIPFPEGERTGEVWEMTLKAAGLDSYDYAFEADGETFPDPCGRSFIGHDVWGDPANAEKPLRTPIRQHPFDWEGDKPLHIPYDETIVYRAHLRGFTMHRSSGVRGKGTFHGMMEKIPYLRELGITTLELMPIDEFQEVMISSDRPEGPGQKARVTGLINYWGYSQAFLFAPKASYAGAGKDPVTELKRLIKALHQAGIELVVEFYLTGQEEPSLVDEALRYWVREYHLDGIHLIGPAPLTLLADDPYLAQTKLWADFWDEDTVNRQGEKHLGIYGSAYRDDIRRILKGDDDQMRSLAAHLKDNPLRCASLNFLTGSNSFTLMDMVTYEKKNNIANGENNRDGSDYNYTWNCGVEGPSRKRSVINLRRQQVANALALLFLSQGTPVLQAGDEFGNSQSGNNNAYCQDNEISWINWRQLKNNKWLYEFTRALIAFRKAHPVFHQSRELQGTDTLGCGCPDVSYHGAKAWVPDFDVFSRKLGIFLCGAPARRKDGTADDYFYIACNMYREAGELALPNLPRPYAWYPVMDTAKMSEGAFFTDDKETKPVEGKIVEIPAHTVRIYIGKVGENASKNKKTVKKTGKRSQK